MLSMYANEKYVINDKNKQKYSINKYVMNMYVHDDTFRMSMSEHLSMFMHAFVTPIAVWQQYLDTPRGDH